MRGSPHGVHCSSGCKAATMASVRAAVRAAVWSPIGEASSHSAPVIAVGAAAARDVRARVPALARGCG